MNTTKTTKIGKQVIEYTHTQTRELLAGSYRGRDIEDRVTRTHLVFCNGNDEWVRTGCRQPVERMADSGASSEEDLAAVPTCPTCAKRYHKLHGTL